MAKSSIGNLAQNICRQSSAQSYYTAKFLVPKAQRQACMAAYAYFRWLDDQIDLHTPQTSDRLALIKRQKSLIQKSYQHHSIHPAKTQEELLISLITQNQDPYGLLASFIEKFIQIIEFDAGRQHRQLTAKQLTWYTGTLGRAVTDGINYFTDINNPPIKHPNRYHAATAACLTHLLRDYHQDLDQGYFNLPLAHQSQALSPSLVKILVDRARHSFQTGKVYINTLKSIRLKLAASWYCLRFEPVLDQIEADSYRLRPHYQKPSSIKLAFRFFTAARQSMQPSTVPAVQSP